MAGFRLDQRRYALPNRVGANGARIVPGDSGNSFLYEKIAGNGNGLRMPPTGPLSKEQIDTIKAWIDQGAEWPDELAGERPRVPPDPAVTRLMNALRNGDRQAFEKLLKQDPKIVTRRGPAGSTPLMYAALYGDAASVKLLLKSGANPKDRNDSGATALMWATGDAEKTRLLLESGADPNVQSSEGRTALMAAVTRFGSAPVVKLLLDHGADPKIVTPQRQGVIGMAAAAGDEEVFRMVMARMGNPSNGGPLYAAVQSRCTGCMQLLLDAAPKPALNRAMATSAMIGDTATLKTLLDRGADVNAPDPAGLGASALCIAASTEAAGLDSVRVLVERGADLRAKDENGRTALDLALRAGASPLAEFLRKAGAPAGDPSPMPAVAPKPATSVRSAVERSIPPLQRSDVTFIQKAGCVSCHNNSLTLMTVAAARKYRIPVNDTIATDQMRITGLYLENWRERVLQGIAIPGSQDTISYILLGLAAVNYPQDPGTDAMAYFLKGAQRPDGSWRLSATGGFRSPLESSEIQVTAVTMRALQVYAPKAWRNQTNEAVRRAGIWLAKAQPKTNEDRTFQVLGLHWAGANSEVIHSAARELIDQQRPDGGWAQLPSMSSDAYATGEALYALHESAEMDASKPQYQRGLGFLRNSQLEDGSWFVRTRAIAIQPQFDAGFPHGRDQFISAAATNWAVMALMPAAEPDKKR